MKTKYADKQNGNFGIWWFSVYISSSRIIFQKKLLQIYVEYFGEKYWSWLKKSLQNILSSKSKFFEENADLQKPSNQWKRANKWRRQGGDNEEEFLTAGNPSDCKRGRWEEMEAGILLD